MSCCSKLHDHGVFELLRGALGASDKLIETAVDAAKSDESIRAIRNAMILGKMLGAINPDVLQCVAVGSQRDAGMLREADHRAARPFLASQSVPPQGTAQKHGSHEPFLEKPGQSNQAAWELQIKAGWIFWWTWSGSNRGPLPCHGTGETVSY